MLASCCSGPLPRTKADHVRDPLAQAAGHVLALPDAVAVGEGVSARENVELGFERPSALRIVGAGLGGRECRVVAALVAADGERVHHATHRHDLFAAHHQGILDEKQHAGGRKDVASLAMALEHELQPAAGIVRCPCLPGTQASRADLPAIQHELDRVQPNEQRSEAESEVLQHAAGISADRRVRFEADTPQSCRERENEALAASFLRRGSPLPRVRHLRRALTACRPVNFPGGGPPANRRENRSSATGLASSCRRCYATLPRKTR